MVKLKKQDLINDSKYIVPISFDLVFKEVFGKKKNSDITALLVSALLDIPYNDVKGKIEFKNTSLSNQTVASKHSEKDILFTVDITKPLCINLEMNQKDLDQHKIERNVYYHADTYSSTLEEGTDYDDIPKTIQFNFSDKYVNQKDKPLIDSYFYKDDFNHILTEKNEIVFLHIADMAKMWYDGTYLNYPNIKPVIFLLSAIMLENEKDKFDKLLKNKLISNNISNQIGKAVYKMNNQKKVKNNYDDWYKKWIVEEQKSMANVAREEAIERKAKEISREEAMPRAKEITEEMAKEMAEKMAMPRAKEIAEEMAKKMAKSIVQEKTKSTTDGAMNLILFMIDQGYSKEEIASAGKTTVEEVEKVLNDRSLENNGKSK